MIYFWEIFILILPKLCTKKPRVSWMSLGRWSQTSRWVVRGRNVIVDKGPMVYLHPLLTTDGFFIRLSLVSWNSNMAPDDGSHNNITFSKHLCGKNTLSFFVIARFFPLLMRFSNAFDFNINSSFSKSFMSLHIFGKQIFSKFKQHIWNLENWHIAQHFSTALNYSKAELVSVHCCYLHDILWMSQVAVSK